MNVLLWIVASALAALFLFAGSLKLFRSKHQLVATMGWVEDFSPGTIKLIGAAEIAGALGLILPAALDIAPILTPLAATGLAIVQLLAIPVHARRHESQLIVLNVVLFALAAFVAVMRFGPYAF
jgi:hypothetical protein